MYTYTFRVMDILSNIHTVAYPDGSHLHLYIYGSSEMLN